VNGRSWSERDRRRRERRETGRTSLRVSRSTRDSITRLMQLMPPYEVRGVDELIAELVQAEIDRRSPPKPDPAQIPVEWGEPQPE